jgi:hypothetical protein
MIIQNKNIKFDWKVLAVALFFMFFVFSFNGVIAEGSESCYVKVNINENVINNESIGFSLNDISNIYGTYSGAVRQYSEDIPPFAILSVYSKTNGLIGKYDVGNALMFIVEDFSDSGPTGDLIMSDSGVASVIIPYGNNIGAMKVEFNGTETDLNVDTSKIKCERTCKIEGEFGSYDSDRCCLGFAPLQQNDGGFVCAKVGDGICSLYEDYSNSEDCYYSCPKEFGNNCSVTIVRNDTTVYPPLTNLPGILDIIQRWLDNEINLQEAVVGVNWLSM